jgi:hypothetical protein
MVEESIKIKSRIGIFMWDIFLRPISNFFSSKVKASDLVFALWIISTICFGLEKISYLPKDLKFLSNIFLNLGLLLIYIVLILIYRWTNGIDIGNYRKEKGYPNPQEIHRMKLNYQKEVNSVIVTK